jgi:hypothetical protein
MLDGSLGKCDSDVAAGQALQLLQPLPQADREDAGGRLGAPPARMRARPPARMHACLPGRNARSSTQTPPPASR